MYLLNTAGHLVDIINMDLAKISVGMDLDILRKQAVIQNTVVLIDTIMVILLQTKVSEEEPIEFDTDTLHTWGHRVLGSNIMDYQSSMSSVNFPLNILSRYNDTEVFQFVTTLNTNPYYWGFVDGMVITSKVVRVAFTFVNETFVEVSEISPDNQIEISMQRNPISSYQVFSPDLQMTDNTTLEVKGGFNTSHTIELSPGDSKYTRVCLPVVRNNETAAAVTVEVFTTNQQRTPENAVLFAFTGLDYVAHQFKYDKQYSVHLEWNQVYERYQADMYTFLSSKYVYSQDCFYFRRFRKILL